MALELLWGMYVGTDLQIRKTPSAKAPDCVQTQSQNGAHGNLSFPILNTEKQCTKKKSDAKLPWVLAGTEPL